MNEINNLIQELCPDGVEYKELAKVLVIKNGKDYKGFGSGDVPVYGSGGIMTYIDHAAYDKPSVLIPRKGSLDKLYYVDTPFWTVDTIFYTVIDTKVVEPKYIYYVLQKEHLEKLNKAGGVPSLTQAVVSKVKIPVPPLQVQREIVRVLDNFTELTAELTARKKQYEYYRNTLLTFSTHKEETFGTKWRMLGEVCDVITGGEPPVDCIKGENGDDNHCYPVWGNGKDVYGYSASYKVNKDAVAISSIGANTGTVYFRKAFFTPIIRLKVVIPKDDTVNTRYLFHALSAMEIKSKSSSVPNMNASEIKSLKIAVPPIERQVKIAETLDNFDAICSDLNIGLPAEIEARKKQYEYYRDMLLTFAAADDIILTDRQTEHN